MDRKFITERRYSILIHGHIELINIRNYMKNKYTIVRSGGGLFTKQLNSNFRKRGGRYLVCHLGDGND